VAQTEKTTIQRKQTFTKNVLGAKNTSSRQSNEYFGLSGECEHWQCWYENPLK